MCSSSIESDGKSSCVSSTSRACSDWDACPSMTHNPAGPGFKRSYFADCSSSGSCGRQNSFFPGDIDCLPPSHWREFIEARDAVVHVLTPLRPRQLVANGLAIREGLKERSRS